MRVFIYCRAAGHESGSSQIAEQLERCRDYARSRGMIVIGEVVDVPASGLRDDRPGFAALLAAVLTGGIAAVLTTDLDRLSCSLPTQDQFLTTAVKHGVRIFAIDWDRPEGGQGAKRVSFWQRRPAWIDAR